MPRTVMNCGDYFRSFSNAVIYLETMSAQQVTAGFISGRIIAGLFHPSLPFHLNFPQSHSSPMRASSEAAAAVHLHCCALLLHCLVILVI